MYFYELKTIQTFFCRCVAEYHQCVHFTFFIFISFDIIINS
jgi:hypothetical protein